MKKFLWNILNISYQPATFSKDPIKSILVIRMNRIGDMICTIPLLKTLRKEFQEASINLLAEETNAEVIRGASYIDKIMVVKKNKAIFKNKLVNMVKILKDMDFDIAIGVKGGFSSNLAAAVFLSRAAYRIGYISESHHPLELLYNLPIKKSKAVKHQVEQCLDLLSPLGIPQERYIKDISLEIPEKSSARFRDFTASHNIKHREKLAVINLSNDSEKKKWPVENFSGLIKKMNTDSINCIITAAPPDFEKARKLAEASRDNKSDTVFYETPHIMDFAAASKAANILISHDSGAMHIGAAVNTKVMVIAGRGINPMVWGPYGEGHRCLLKPRIQDLTVDEVYREILWMLNEKN